MYDVRKGRKWTQDAPRFGITFGGRHISVHIELPSTYPVRPDGYRQFLRYTAEQQSQVLATDFASLVLEHRPQWLIDIIRQEAPDNPNADDIQKELQNLLNELRMRRSDLRPVPQGEVGIARHSGPGMVPERVPDGGTRDDRRARAKPTDLTALPPGARRVSAFENREHAPKIIQLKTLEEVEERGFAGRAARYYRESNELFVNLLYPAVDKMRGVLEAEFADVVDDIELMRHLARIQAEKQLTLRVGRAVVFALAKRLDQDWDSNAVDKAMGPESLSLVAEDYTGSLQTARRSMGSRLRPNRQEPPAEAA
jgi:hypothetical protein